MRELFVKLFEQSHFGTGITVKPYNLPHLVYLGLIFGTIFFLYMRLRNSGPEQKKKAMGGLVNVLMLSYLSDFFVQQFVYGGMTEEKLPFHICIVTAVLMPLVQYNKKFEKMKEPVAVLATLSSLMYLSFPASVGGGEPWCYQTVQVMFFHGTQLVWGILNLLLGIVEPQMRRVWRAGALLLGITFWAKLGNLIYDRNFFFLEEDAFFIGLVEQGIIEKWVLMVLNPLVYFMAVLALYGVCYGIRRAAGKSRMPAIKKLDFCR